MAEFKKCVYLGKERIFPNGDGEKILKKGTICEVELLNPEPDSTFYKMKVEIEGTHVYIPYASMVDVYIDWLNLKK